jgi:hypothetical protein
MKLKLYWLFVLAPLMEPGAFESSSSSYFRSVALNNWPKMIFSKKFFIFFFFFLTTDPGIPNFAWRGAIGSVDRHCQQFFVGNPDKSEFLLQDIILKVDQH